MKPQPERGILQDPLRRQTKTSNFVSKIYCQGERVNGSPWNHYARPIHNEGRDSASLRPNRFTGRSSSSTSEVLEEPLGPLSPSKAPREDGTTNLWCFPATLQVPGQPLVVILLE